ncbi:hypothetical protein M0C34_01715 [Agarivorans sp. TSD2052]|uniref:hypothetical protein n=1 Tax=Agarivorans sp. TSD2052 TaxID=2937286 RepID=UPI00200DA29A|nr:hypothetical protein [Agarivorans sp. TSD2052]UPW19019.1 hypothetical protein M0C34_01715 [Agarivorans sp. TSD2052]
MELSIWKRFKKLIGKALLEQQRVWIISRHDSLAQQDIYPLSESELSQRTWQQRGFSVSAASRIERLLPGSLIELPCQEHHVTVTRVK